MESYMFFHHLMLLLFFLALPRLPTTPRDESDDMMEVLVLRRVSYVAGEGLSVCFVRLGGLAPDVTLQYSSTYSNSSSSSSDIVGICSGYLTQHSSLHYGDVFYCLPPCPGANFTYERTDPLTVVVSGHDRITGELQAALMDSFALSDLTPTVIQAGEGVVKVQLNAPAGKELRVQLWHHKTNENKGIDEIEEEVVQSEMTEGSELEANEGEMEKVSGEEMKNRTLNKVRECYHALEKEEDADDDDDDDDSNDEDDHEEDNDDFVKFMRWRKCVALHSPYTKTAPPSEPASRHSSVRLSCASETCVYYFTDVSTSGLFSIEVVDVTDAVISSFHTKPRQMKQWNRLSIDTLLIASHCGETQTHTKSLRVTLSTTSEEQQQPAMSQVEGEEVVSEVEREQGDLQVMLINGHNQSEVLQSLPGECDLLAGICCVDALQTFVDPEDGGPASKMFLLLHSHQSSVSNLVSFIDVHIRVHKVAPGKVIVIWDREPLVHEFLVRVIPDSGQPSDSLTVTCRHKGSDCLATFSRLASGRYRAELSYTTEGKVVLSTHFHMDDVIIT